MKVVAGGGWGLNVPIVTIGAISNMTMHINLQMYYSSCDHRHMLASKVILVQNLLEKFGRYCSM